MTDYKQLCAELHAAFNTYAVDMAHHDLLERVRAALAEPEPDGPTDEEIMELMPQQMREDLAAAARAITDQANTYDTRAKGMMRIILNCHCVNHARAVLARWGSPS